MSGRWSRLFPCEARCLRLSPSSSLSKMIPVPVAPTSQYWKLARLTAWYLCRVGDSHTSAEGSSKLRKKCQPRVTEKKIQTMAQAISQVCQ